jgi:hypothetical protein
MLTKTKIARAALVALAVSMIVPVASTVIAQTERGSGYMVAWLDSGDPDCVWGGPSDCPQS